MIGRIIVRVVRRNGGLDSFQSVRRPQSVKLSQFCSIAKKIILSVTMITDEDRLLLVHRNSAVIANIGKYDKFMSQGDSNCVIRM